MSVMRMVTYANGSDTLGTVLVELSSGGEVTRLAELDRRVIARSEHELNVVRHYARHGVFTLTTDTKPEGAVSLTGKRRVRLNERASATADSEPRGRDLQCSG